VINDNLMNAILHLREVGFWNLLILSVVILVGILIYDKFNNKDR